MNGCRIFTYFLECLYLEIEKTDGHNQKKGD